jgi:predicted metalloprotease with PDZ domain
VTPTARVMAVAALLVSAAPLGAAERILLELDAREAPRRILHARLSIPVRPGPLTLLYPKWLPGEHGPTGPIADVAGIALTAGGRPVAWQRDPVDMHALHCEVPAGVSVLEMRLDFLTPAAAGGFSSGASATADLALVSWNQVLFYPRGGRPDDLEYEASLRLPPGWTHASALSVVPGEAADPIRFAPVSLTTLVDSPLLAGAHFRVVALDEGAPPHRLNIAADSAAALEIRPETVAQYRNLVRETGALFGSRPYRKYDFLLALSDTIAHFGLEHHESSDNRWSERALVDEDKRRAGFAGLLPHEMVHTWNAKYRRPAGLAIGRFDEPMKGELLWVYEGLTTYLGGILTARSGLLTADEYRQDLALTAAEMGSHRGRSWRPLADTAVAAQILFGARPDGRAWRRGVDFYAESNLLWLEADTLIRRLTEGRKSLDDFCRAFHGGHSGSPSVLPYTFDDVVAGLNQVAPHDWRSFWRKRLDATGEGAPLEGIAASGWRLVYKDTPSSMQKAHEDANETTDVRYSLGFVVTKDGTIPDVVPDSPAARAGVAAGGKLIAVNGRRWSGPVLREAIRAAKDAPVELIVQHGEFIRTHRCAYSEGERYPHLERDQSRPDLLADIIRPKSTPKP